MNQPAKPEKQADIRKIIEQAVTKAVDTALAVGIKRGKEDIKNAFSQTEVRLYAYPDLKDNIKQYELDIRDLETEKPGRSKSLVFFSTGSSGIRLSEEDIQQGRILHIQNKIRRDQEEIEEIDRALEPVASDQYFSIIELKYFKRKTDEEIAEAIPCDPRTVRRNKNRIVRRIAIKLYGADAVKVVNMNKG
jgi:hypothetical protein